MGVQEFLDYNNYIELQNKQLEIWGQPCRIYIPKNKVNLGYENTTSAEVEKMNSDKVLANEYTKYDTEKIWINFTVNKSVFYKFNWFPEDGEELCSAFMNANSFVREGAYIRTSLPEQTSIWGDIIFTVVKIQDVGLGRTLQRMYFLKPCQNADLYKTLNF